MLSIIKRILTAFFRRLLYVISFPVALLLILISPIIKIRFIGLQAFRIGHYALNTELMLCALDIDKPSRKIKTIFYNMSEPCNTQLYRMWKRVIPIFPFSRLAIQIDQVLCYFFGKSYCEEQIKKTYESCATGALDNEGLLKKINKPRLFFTKKESANAKSIMKKMGMPDGVQFVCLIVRDSAYLNQQYPETDWKYHNHRDANIESYKKSALYLASKGYYVIRMGKFVNQLFDVDHPNVIDYANHSLRSDFMDIYLSANCLFCISTCTGLDCVSQIFRKPILHTNISPIFSETLMWYPCTLFIPKLLKNKNNNQFLMLSETNKICASLPSHDTLAELTRLNLAIVENDENQLLEAVIEMEARVCGVWHETFEQKEKQVKYWLNQRKHRPIFVDDIYIKIGTNFLQKQNLLLN